MKLELMRRRRKEQEGLLSNFIHGSYHLGRKPRTHLPHLFAHSSTSLHDVASISELLDDADFS